MYQALGFKTDLPLRRQSSRRKLLWQVLVDDQKDENEYHGQEL